MARVRMCTEGEVKMSEAKRIKYVSFRLTDEEYTEIERAAVAAGDDRGAIVVLSEYRQQHCRKFVTSEPRQSLPSALSS